jgi:hypothetical protein
MPTRCLIILTVHSTFKVCFQWHVGDALTIQIESEIQDLQLSFVHQLQNAPPSSTLEWF